MSRREQQDKERLMKRPLKPFVVIAKSDLKAAFRSMALRDAVFRKAPNAAAIRAGILPRKS
jgi:hypothetical protein